MIHKIDPPPLKLIDYRWRHEARRQG